ncbi:TAXI family TRAP transporter solute-binding subunit [Streptomyces sp. NPDC021100]|uniref:TAXI family TRAP transporter solute-binding subunit n=1 Tax=Streptomyces sp. NPDC021100 TaxID=3365114 RepID=UPI0037B271C8
MVPRTPWVRRRTVWAGALSAALLALLTWSLAAPPEDPMPGGRITVATGVPTGVYAKYGALLKEDLHRDLPALDVRLRLSTGSVDNLRRLTTGDADFAIATADAAADYVDNDRPGSDRLRACARLYDDYMQLVVPRDASAQSIRDLKGLKVGVGAEGSGVQLITRRLFQAAGLNFTRDITPVQVGIDRMPDLLEKGDIDAFFWSGGLPTSAVLSLSRRMPVRLVQLGDMIGPLRTLGRETRFYRAAVMPADAYPAMRATEVVKTIAVANLLITTEDTDARLTEGVTRTVIASRDRIGQVVHAAQRVDLRTAVFTDPLPLHSGARRYYVSTKP